MGAGCEEPCVPYWGVWRSHSIGNGESLKVYNFSRMDRFVFCGSVGRI